jgi:phosphoesterase RecJ-like protein
MLLASDSVVICTHIRPDGDAIGSQLALAHFLEAQGITAHCINTDAAAPNLTWMPGAEALQTFDGSLAQRQLIDAADVIAIVDTNKLSRIGEVHTAVEASQAPRVLIDHHLEPEPGFDATFSRDTASSTGELIYELIAAHDATAIDEAIATNLYVAIMTDTGSFRYSSVTPRVHDIIADLLRRGDLSPEPIHSAIYDTRTFAGLRLLSRSLDTLRVRYDGFVSYMLITRQMLDAAEASTDDAEGFVNYPLSMRGVQAALLFTETAKGVKISFRSKGDVAINGWAKAFGGGGHRNASGVFIEGALDEVVEAVIAAAPTHLDLPAGATAEASAPDEAPAPDLTADDEAYLSQLLNLQSDSPQ